MLHPRDRITTPQTAVILINAILASGILTLPRTSTANLKTPDAWISVIIGGLFAMLVGGVSVALSRQFPGQTFFQYNKELVGKWVGGGISLLLIGYLFTLAGFELRSLAEVTGFFLLEGTPSWAIIMPFIWVGLYLIMGGINSIARLFEIIFPVTVLVFLLLCFMSFGIFELDNLRPVLGSGIWPVLSASKTTALAFLGPEFMVILVALMQRPDKAPKAVLIGILIPMIFYVLTVVMVIGALSVDGVVVRTWPTIDLIRSFEIPGFIFERFESLLLMIWIMQIFSTFTITYYASALGLAQVFDKNIQPIMYGLIPILYIIALLPKNTNEWFKLGDRIGEFSLVLISIILLLLIRSKLRGRTG